MLQMWTQRLGIKTILVMHWWGQKGEVCWAKEGWKGFCDPTSFKLQYPRLFSPFSFMTHVKFVIYREYKGHHTPSAINPRLSNNLGLNPACTAADNRIWLQIKKILNSVLREGLKKERVWTERDDDMCSQSREAPVYTCVPRFVCMLCIYVCMYVLMPLYLWVCFCSSKWSPQ
jgi:hypothetical protein